MSGTTKLSLSTLGHLQSEIVMIIGSKHGIRGPLAFLTIIWVLVLPESAVDQDFDRMLKNVLLLLGCLLPSPVHFPTLAV